MKKLTGKQQNFVNEYLIDLNATAAAKRAGYSEKSANPTGCETLANPSVAAEIAKRRQRMIEKLEITQEMIVQELAKLGFSNMGDYMRAAPNGDVYLDFSGLTEAQTAALTSVTVDVHFEQGGDDAVAVKRTRFQLADKHKALVSLAKILGFMPTRVTVSAPDGGPVQLLGLTPDELRARAARIIGSIEEEVIEAEPVEDETE